MSKRWIDYVDLGTYLGDTSILLDERDGQTKWIRLYTTLNILSLSHQRNSNLDIMNLFE